MNNILFMSEESSMGNCAGSKARNDLELIFNEMDFNKLGKRLQNKEKRTFLYFLRNYFIASKVNNQLKKLNNDIILFQYPISKGVILKDVIQRKSKTNKIILFIHDIDYLRREGEEGKDEEIAFLNCAHVLICHNSTMIDKLKADGVKVNNIINLEIFDYLLNSSCENLPKFGKDIVYAGNLNKGGFIEKLKKNSNNFEFHLHLYGINYEDENTDKVQFEGSFSPEELVRHLNYSYGLVWDSLVPETCEGFLGKYTQYNNPHKLSLYMSAGLPVIVWSKSAIAKFVEKYNVGVIVDSLYDIDNKLNKITEEKYNRFIENVSSIKQNVRCGYYAKRAIQSAIDFCKNN